MLTKIVIIKPLRLFCNNLGAYVWLCVAVQSVTMTCGKVVDASFSAGSCDIVLTFSDIVTLYDNDMRKRGECVFHRRVVFLKKFIATNKDCQSATAYIEIRFSDFYLKFTCLR